MVVGIILGIILLVIVIFLILGATHSDNVNVVYLWGDNIIISCCISSYVIDSNTNLLSFVDKNGIIYDGIEVYKIITDTEFLDLHLDSKNM